MITTKNFPFVKRTLAYERLYGEIAAFTRMQYGRNWKSKILTDLTGIPAGYKSFFWFPFGRPDWNYYRHFIRRHYAFLGEYKYPDINDYCPQFSQRFSTFINNSDKLSLRGLNLK